MNSRVSVVLVGLVAVSALAQDSVSRFEEPDLAQGTGTYYGDALVWYRTYSAGALLDGWMLTAGTVDIVRHTTGTARDGQQSIDLSGGNAGTLQRTFATVAGRNYRLEFDFSGNPVGGGVRGLEVRVNGKTAEQFSWDTEAKGNSFQQDMMWEHRTVNVAATSTETTIELASLNPGFSGPEIDNIAFSLVAILPEDSLSRFEEPDVSQGTGIYYPDAYVWYRTYSEGAVLDGWTVESGTVDIVRHITGAAREGQQSIDLNGQNAGTLRRVFNTLPGKSYRLEFDFSGNPIGGGVRALEVWVNGTTAGEFAWDPLAKQNSFQLDMKWERRAVALVATSPVTTIELVSSNAGSSGPEIDNLAFFAVEYAAVAVEGAVILSWLLPPGETQGTVLESAEQLSGPWTAVVEPTLKAVAANGTVSVALPVGGGARFYRVRNAAGN